MNTMNINYFQPDTKKQKIFRKVFSLINKLMLVISVYLIFGLLFQYAEADNTVDPYQSQHGAVWLLTDNGAYMEAMQMQTDVDMKISGAIARARVKQQFQNNSALWTEGIYVFPLPENAAVDQFKMIIGERIIEGQVKERNSARKTYEKAKATGKKTSLMEQQRPNVFTTSLANIAPGEAITIEFEYQQILSYRDDSYRLRYPMVVGPRYHASNTFAEHTLSMTRLEASDDPSVYTETDPLKNTHNPTRIHIMLDAGTSLSELKSSYHKIDIQQTSETRYSISTIGENIPAERDFELVWQPELYNKPQLTAFTEKVDGIAYTMLTLLPPDLSYLQEKVQARDVIFVLDVSGSMSGKSIEQAKASLITALDGLTAIDRFNIIWFNHDTDRLFSETVTATDENRLYAKQFVMQLHADGGTEMLPALKLALAGQEAFSRLRQVIFLTDGNINNETELFAVIDQQLGNSRLFTIGIGSAPNAYFMRKAASKGRGTFTYIGDVNEVQKKTVSLLKKLETPALINIQLITDPHTDKTAINDKNTIEFFPKTIPDLYAGEPLTLFIKAKKMPDSISLAGDYGNSEWQTSAVIKNTSQSGIRIAWAREKISSMMDQIHESRNAPDIGETKREIVRQQVIETALKHHLVSRFTSLVAVDVTPANDSGLLYQERMKNNLPHGWKKSSPEKQLIPANQMILASLQLPQTASSSRLNMLLAVILFFMGMLLYLWKNTAR